MKFQISVISILLLLGGCYSSRETVGNYNLPTFVAKEPTKTGKACARYFPLISKIFYSADTTVESARKDGNIQDIISIETENFSFPGYSSKCTIVHGN